MNILLLASHGIAEYDDIRMFAHLGMDVFCPGGYAEPAKPGETLRPALPEVPYHPELALLCDAQRAKHPEEPGRYIDWAKADLHPQLIEWADVIIVHHFVREWIGEQWPRIRHKRVIWRTCGQSDPSLERYMKPFRADGLQIVRYSPAEKRYFESIGAFAGQDALIRFGKFVDDYGPWIGDDAVVGNVTQRMVERGDATGYSFYLAATKDLPAKPAGPGSEQLPGGIGELGYDAMREYLRHIRCYLYTGTTPASYTLGLIEAMLTGVPVVSIGPKAWAGPPELLEGHSIAGRSECDPRLVRKMLEHLLKDEGAAASASRYVRQQSLAMFGIDTIGAQWVDFLTPQEPARAMATGAWDGVL